MSKIRVRVLALAIVVALVVLAFLVRQGYVSRREALLMSFELSPGAPRGAVVHALGQPDHELTGGDVQKYASGFEPGCVSCAATKLGYAPPKSGGGPYVAIYLDSGGRVLCVEHGFIAIN